MHVRLIRVLLFLLAVPMPAVTTVADAQERLQSLAGVQLDASLAAVDRAITEAEADSGSNRQRLAALRSQREEMIAGARDLRTFRYNPFDNVPPPVAYIVNGATTFAFGATGALLWRQEDGEFGAHCSGAMIGCETFLTARHCVEHDLESSNYSVYLQGEGVLEVEDILPAHPDYAPPYADLQLLKLSSPVTAVRPVSIVGTEQSGAGMSGTITGFGHTRPNGNDHGLKRYGAVSTLSCEVSGSQGEPLEPDGFICWKFDNKMANTCHVDSGGPLFSGIITDDDDLIGIASGGDQQCAGDLHSVNADLGYFSGWIVQTGGDDVAVVSCTPPGRGGIEFVTAYADESSVTEQGAEKSYDPLELHPGTTEVRIALNAEDRTENDIDLRVELGTTDGRLLDTPCNQAHGGNFSFCSFAVDEPGAVVTILVSQKGEGSGSGGYQLLVSELRYTGGSR